MSAIRSPSSMGVPIEAMATCGHGLCRSVWGQNVSCVFCLVCLCFAFDARSKGSEVTTMKSPTTEKTISSITMDFSWFHMKLMLSCTLMECLTSSVPCCPATKGLEEKFVQTMKRVLKTSLGQGTLHCTSPHATTMTSPANLMIKVIRWICAGQELHRTA